MILQSLRLAIANPCRIDLRVRRVPRGRTRRSILPCVGLAFFATVAWATWASGQSVTLGASSSNTLIQVASSAGTAQLSNGQGDIYVGRTNQDRQGPPTMSIRRGLVAFDIADNVPAGATITGVTLAMQDEMGMNGNQTISLSRMLRAWGQGASFFPGGIGAAAANNDVTWYYTFFNASNPAASPAWSVPGGQPGVDFSSTASAQALDSTSATSQTVVWSSTASPAMIADVQDWLDSPATNFGWIMIGNESAGQTAKRFGGQYAPAQESPPQLTVQYNTLPWTWTGGDGDAAWSSSGNWSAGSGSLSGNVAVVLGSSAESGGMVNLLSTSASVSQLTFASAQPVTLTSAGPGGGQLTLDNGSSTIAVVVSSSGDAINAGVAVSLNSDAAITTTASGDSLLIAGNIGDGTTPHGIDNDGAGTLILSGSNTYTGGTTVNAGTLLVDSSRSIADGTNLTVGADAVLAFGSSADFASFEATRDARPQPFPSRQPWCWPERLALRSPPGAPAQWVGVPRCAWPCYWPSPDRDAAAMPRPVRPHPRRPRQKRSWSLPPPAPATQLTKSKRRLPATARRFRTSCASSAVLAQQVLHGADADILISADEASADLLAKQSLVAETKLFLGNRLVVVVPSDSLLEIRRPADLAAVKIAVKIDRLALGDPDSVPAGAYAKKALVKLGLWDKLKTKVAAAGDVRQALAYVETGAAAAGIVYATDAAVSKKVRVACEIPEDLTGPVRYPFVLLKHGAESAAANAFYRFLLSPEAAAVYRKHGFTVLR